MRRNNLWRWIIMGVCFLTAIIYLRPTFQYYNNSVNIPFFYTSEEYKNNPDNELEMADLSRKALKRGLDLQGGVRLTQEIDLADLIEQLAENKDTRFDELFNYMQDVSILEVDYLSQFLREAETRNLRLERYFTDDKRLDENNDVRSIEQYLRDMSEDGILQALEILRNRIDEFGVAEPNIQREGNYRIIIELAGVDNVERAKELVGRTAKLEFKPLKPAEVAENIFDSFDQLMRMDKLGETLDSEQESTADDSTTAPKAASTMTETSIAELLGQTDTTLSEELGESTVIFDRQTFDDFPFRSFFINISTIGGWHGVIENNVALINRLLAREDFQRIIPTDAAFYWSAKPDVIDGRNYYELFLLDRDASLGGDVITDARVTIGQGYDLQTAGKPMVSMEMNGAGSRRWEQITGDNVQSRIAIVLDDKVFSAPTVINKISGGNSQITGIGTMDEAKDLAIVLKAGAFSADMNIIAQQTVGPSLGADSIRKGTFSIIVGFLLVFLFMIVYYKMSGSIATLALMLNLLFVMAILAGFHATLTLPGIAGLILTIGMAVDANVLIFERIREELTTGKTIRAAIDSGYSRAFRTILDANLTTLIAAVMLYQFGTGAIKGFALVLMIGISSSMFTAIVFTRIVFDFVTSKWNIQKLSI